VWYKIITVSICLAGMLFPLQAQSVNNLIRSGNRAFEQGAMEKAMEAYRKAMEKDAGNPKASYNMGAAEYESKQYDKAEQHFRESLEQLKDPQQISNAWHNTGNSLFRQDKLEESIAAYQQALRNDPTNENARYNLLMAKKKLQQQQEQQQQQQKKNDQQQPPPKGDEEKQDEKDGQQPPPKDPGKEEQPAQPQPDVRNEEKLKQLLKALEQEESRVQQKLFGNEGQRPAKSKGKDW
jgi:Ca-activated chloride channel homolog